MDCARGVVVSSMDEHDGTVVDVAEFEHGDAFGLDLSDLKAVLEAFSKELSARAMEKSESSSQEERA
eukprot:11063835-Lingulodinium_polyedra.AAC.1